jgi:hypothetical protein
MRTRHFGSPDTLLHHDLRSEEQYGSSKDANLQSPTNNPTKSHHPVLNRKPAIIPTHHSSIQSRHEDTLSPSTRLKPMIPKDDYIHSTLRLSEIHELSTASSWLLGPFENSTEPTDGVGN